MHSKKWYNEFIIKLFWERHKKAVMVVAAAVFLTALFLVKYGVPWSNTILYAGGGGLRYQSALIEDLMKKDGDGDGVLDWEEGLWGLDPTKPETTPGTPDQTVINKLRTENPEGPPNNGTGGNPYGDDERLTETDKFSRELFSTVASLNQNGALDQDTIDKITQSLSDQIRNMPQGKIYAVTDLIITPGNTSTDIKNYNNALQDVYKKYPITGNVLQILQTSIRDENTMDVSTLQELRLTTEQVKTRLNAIIKMRVPSSLASVQVNFINSLQKLIEDMEDIQRYETDPIMAMGAINQYDQDVASFKSAFSILTQAVDTRLQN